MRVRNTRRRQRNKRRRVGGNSMDIYVVTQIGDDRKIWDIAYRTFADALYAVGEYITNADYEDEIEPEKSREGSENSGLGVAVAHIMEGKHSHIYIRKVSVC
jgi:hypothetical protein